MGKLKASIARNETAVEALARLGHTQAVAVIAKLEAGWRKSGNGRHVDWWDVCAGKADGASRTVEGHRMPVVQEFRDRKGFDRSNVEPLFADRATPVGSEYSAMLAPTALNPAVFQPPGRDQRSMAGLRNDILSHGMHQEVHVVHRPPLYIYAVADGHRRLRVALDLQLQQIRVRVHTTGTPGALYGELNRDTATHSSYEWMCAWLNSPTTDKVMPKRGVMNQIERAMKVLGGADEVRRILVDTRKSPGLVGWAEKAVLGLTVYASCTPVPSVKVVAEWMAKHDQQGPFRNIVNKTRLTPGKRGEGAYIRLFRAITADRPL